ncbi:hypothetical protein NHX12_026365 [Muraenolepis orangiensis]|uniref:Uncharacterized protein n=1 Tax=Muraenolepis orangiensis TaxID=630683 RepID=A0A9Q0EHD2_9TELE|nr:hypothetical protein NHX12_026365 [Muraenolepis orangiensis]
MKTFFTVNGSTGVTDAVTAKVKSKGQIEVTSSDQCDYILAFCVISTRAGIDIQETKDKCPAGKPVILVLLHHTFDPEKSVFPGPGVTFWDSILLTVDLLFYEGRLLDCPHNEQELQKVLDVFGRASSKV